MKTIFQAIMILGLTGGGLSTLQAGEQSGEALFKANCATCHVTVHPDEETKLTAPPIMGVMRHVKMHYDTKESAVAFVVDYVQDPDKTKAVYPPNALERFGLMPSLKGAVSPEDLSRIAGYLYDTYPNGQGWGRGKGRGQGHGYKGTRGQGQGYGRGGPGQGNGPGQGRGNGRGRTLQ